MPMKLVLAESAVAAVFLTGGTYLMIRRHGVKIELTRHSEANRKAEALEAQETLQRLAANPKLTVVWQRSGKLEGKRNPIVLCVLKRPIVGLLVRPSGSTETGGRPLLQKLDSVDVEPVLYSRSELPSLISEIAAVHRDDPSSPFSGDLNELLAALKTEGPPETELAFY
ncbi:MAG: hypothetical protein WA715_08270 [Candidatus Acidiferrum sp.]